MRFDLTTLNLVLAIADTRSITRGAERESLALAAASKRLSDLEARLGVTLFERRARGVEPTEAGRALLRHIRTLHASLHALESEVVEFSRGIKGHLRVAANASAIAEHLPADLAAFAKANPGIRISLEELTSVDVQGAVAEGRADAGIFVGPAREAVLDCRPYREGHAGDPGAARPCAGPARRPRLRRAARPRHRRPACRRRGAGADARARTGAGPHAERTHAGARFRRHRAAGRGGSRRRGAAGGGGRSVSPRCSACSR